MQQTGSVTQDGTYIKSAGQMPLGLGFLSEVMLRFDRRVATTRSFEVSEGGGRNSPSPMIPIQERRDAE
jgi:hypothetical protein